jgi:hypothetical protein
VDAARFAIVASTGVLTFAAAPDFENPTDANHDNVYEVTVQASDGHGGTDQQALSVTVTDVVDGGPLYFSVQDRATLGSVTAEKEDIVFFNGTSFSRAFDGSDVGIAGYRIDAFSWVDADSLVLSFDADQSVPGVGTVAKEDLVRFDATSLGATTAGSFSLYFDGSDVGLTKNLDAAELLPNGHLLLSLSDALTVQRIGVADVDLLEFTPTSLGANTAGSFAKYFDGSDVGLSDGSKEDVDAVAVDPSGRLYLSTLDTFAVPGVSGSKEDVFVFTPTSLGTNTAGGYSPNLYFDGSTRALTKNIYAIDLG